MTCIVGMIDGDSVVIGGDSAGLAGWHLTNRADPKVFASKGFVFGFAGSFRLRDIVRYSFKPPKFKGGDVTAYMVSKFVPALRDVVGEEINSKAKTDVPGSFLVGFKGQLFEVDGDFQVGVPRAGFAAVGCGQEVALGALSVLRKHTGGPSTLQASEALKAAEQWNGGVRGPFVIVRGGGK